MKKISYILLASLVSLQTIAQTQWSEIEIQETPVNYNSVNFSSALNGVITGNYGTILRTTDAGLTWSSSSLGKQALNTTTFINDSKGWIVGDSGKIAHTADGGQTWTNQNSQTDKKIVDIHFANDTLGCAVGTAGLILTTQDGGTTWTSHSITSNYSFQNVKFVTDNLLLAAMPDQHHTYRSTDKGLTWEIDSNLNAYMVDDIEVLSPSKIRLLDPNGNCVISNNGGLNWEMHLIANASFKNIDFVDENTGYAVGLHGVIYKTTDGGITWILETLEAGATNLTGIAFASPEIGFAVGESKVFKYQQFGGTKLNDAENLSNFTLLPNPTNDKVTIQFGKSLTGVKIVIQNSVGQVIQRIEHYSGNSIDLNLKGQSGLYLIDIVTAEGKNTTFRVIKK